MPKVNLDESNLVPSIKAVADLIASLGVPALFLDTCNFLDVVRLAMPNRSRPGEAEALMIMRKLAEDSPPSCLLVVSSLIRGEWMNNIQKVTDESTSHLATLEKQSALFHEACRAPGIGLESERTRYAGLGLAKNSGIFPSGWSTSRSILMWTMGVG